jgi:hypothetical protein
MRDEFAQQNKLPGQVITHTVLNEFISRNYACDSLGRYFFQNGPQRVFVTLDATPWVVHITPSDGGLELLTQCNTTIEANGALSDESGNIYILGKLKQPTYKEKNAKQFFTEDCQTVALLHDHDLDHFSRLATLHEEACSFGGSWLWQGKQLPLDPIRTEELAVRFHFIKKPRGSQS